MISISMSLDFFFQNSWLMTEYFNWDIVHLRWKKRDFVFSCSCQSCKQKYFFIPLNTEFSDDHWHILSAAEVKTIS